MQYPRVIEFVSMFGNCQIGKFGENKLGNVDVARDLRAVWGMAEGRIYVGYLPAAVSEKQVEGEFRRFGRHPTKEWSE